MLSDCEVAEGEGFEPPDGYPSVVFKTTALSRSATPPPDAVRRRPLEKGRVPQASL
jgi:hypothetical protein